MFNYKRVRKLEKQLQDTEELIREFFIEDPAVADFKCSWNPPSYWLRQHLEKVKAAKKERQRKQALEREVRDVIRKAEAEKVEKLRFADNYVWVSDSCGGAWYCNTQSRNTKAKEEK